MNGGAARIATAHQVPLDVQSAKFAYQVLSVTDQTGGTIETGEQPRITIKVVDPTNSNTPYDIQAAGSPFLQSSAALKVDLAWTEQSSTTSAVRAIRIHPIRLRRATRPSSRLR